MSDSDGPLRVRPSAPRVAATVMAGGALVCAGTALPWVSFFAGLQSLSGLVGLYGRILFVSGALAVVGGAAMLRLSYAWMKLGAGLLGVVQTLFVLWLLLGLRLTIRGLGMHAMLLARPGPGLFVALAGALVVSTSLVPLIGDLRGRSAVRGPLLLS